MTDTESNQGWWYQEMEGRLMRVEAAIEYHVKHRDTPVPMPGWESLFGRSQELLRNRLVLLESLLNYYNPAETLIWLSQAQSTALNMSERLNTIRTQVVLLTASGQL